MPKYRPESSPVEAAFGSSLLVRGSVGDGGASGVSSMPELGMEGRRVGLEEILFTSIPMNVLGAQQETNQDIPHMATRKVANLKERANGAKTMRQVNRM